MGVPGLWDILRPTGQVQSLTHLAVESGFVANDNGHRAYRIGIDASIWFFHAQGGREGENPELRTLFFRCARLLAMPFLPIFVFDGPKRPKIKRGKAIGGKEHWLVNNLRAVLDAFGFECRTAPGEAEAELAYLNRAGYIDAVLSDDVDCFLFGACTVIRNSSATLSGNKSHGARNADGKDDGQHVNIYKADDLTSHPKVCLSKGGLILIALLRGGDYDQHGIDGCGVTTAHALARAGFGDSLLAAALSSTPAALAAFLSPWRAALCHELRTNASGLAPRKCPTLAQRIPEDFPSLDVLRCYTHPITSEGGGGLDGLWMKKPDVAKVAHVCEQFFEWGIEATIIKRFRSFLWPGAVLRSLLHDALENDRRKGVSTPSKRRTGEAGVETPSKALARTLGGMALGDDEGESALVTSIHGERRHASTDHTLEYRLEIHPAALVARARSGVQGLRTELADSAAVGESDDEEEGDGKKKKGGSPKKPPPEPDSKLRVWMPAVMVRYAHPGLVEAFEEKQAGKKAKRGGKAKRADADADEESDSPVKTKTKVPAKSKTGKGKRSTAREEESGEDSNVQRAKSKAKAKASKFREEGERPVAKGKSKAKAKAGTNKGDAQQKTRLWDDQDPFLVPSSSKQKVDTKATKDADEPFPCKPRPFPMSLDFDPPPPTPLTPPRRRKHSDQDEDGRTGSLTKSPRKSTAHTSPRKAGRSPSPSPVRRPLMRAKMKPLEMARLSTLVVDDDVIIISSDSDAPAPPPKFKVKAKSRGTKKALSSSNTNLGYDSSEIIDLT